MEYGGGQLERVDRYSATDSPLVGAWALFLNHGTFAAINVLGFYRWRQIERKRRAEEEWFETQRRSA